MTPKNFLAEYKCEGCDEVYEMVNCLVPFFYLECEECGVRTKYISRRIEHLSWDWDYEYRL